MTPEERGMKMSRVVSLLIGLAALVVLLVVSTAANVFDVPLWVLALTCCLPWTVIAALWFVVLPRRIQQDQPQDASVGDSGEE